MSAAAFPERGADRGPTARLRRAAVQIGLAGIVLCVIGAFLDHDRFFRSYLFAYLFWLGIPLGCAGLLMLQHLTGGRWGLMIRRPLEAGTRVLPLMAVLFIPLLFGLGSLYVWADPEAVRADPGLQRQRPYLNVAAFTIRALVYFAIWLAGMWLFNRWSEREDRAVDPDASRRLRAASGPGLIVYVLTMTGASIDWVMSIDPHWYSTIFGLILIAGQVLAAMAAMIVAMAALAREPAYSGIITSDEFHDLGNLLLAFVMLWAYIQYSQFLIIWMGNLAEEVPFYVARYHGWFGGVSVSVILLHFAVPFVLLLARNTKRNAAALTAVAAVILLMRFVDLYWLVMPTFAQLHLRHPGEAPAGGVHTASGPHWLDVLIPIAMGGVWTAVYVRELDRRPLLPPNDPRLLAAGAGEHHG